MKILSVKGRLKILTKYKVKKGLEIKNPVLFLIEFSSLFALALSADLTLIGIIF